MTESELLDDDDCDVFTPDAWDIARAIDLEPDAETDRGALDELADAMLVWADGPEVDELTERATEALWSRELEMRIADGLTRVAALGDEWSPAVASASAEFARDPLRAPVTQAVVQQLAWELGSQDAPPCFCLCCIDEGVAGAAPGERRERAVAAALLAVRNAGVPEPDVAAALAANEPGMLATDERRRAVRLRLARLARLARTSLPALAGELERIGAEPLPADPSADDVWEVVAHAPLAKRAKPGLN